MSSIMQPKIITFLADGVIAKGKAVKLGTDGKHVAVCSANTDAAIGIAQNDAAAAEDLVEVAMPGGGAKALAAETITKGKFLVPGAAGSMVQTNASGDHIIAQAMDSAVVGDIFPVVVSLGLALGADN